MFLDEDILDKGTLKKGTTFYKIDKLFRIYVVTFVITGKSKGCRFIFVLISHQKTCMGLLGLHRVFRNTVRILPTLAQ